MGVGKEEVGAFGPLDFETFSRKSLFSWFRVGKTSFTPFTSPKKILEKSPSAPRGKILPTPMFVQMYTL